MIRQDTPKKQSKREIQIQLHKLLSLHCFVEKSTKIQAILGNEDNKTLKINFNFQGYSELRKRL